jgi:hypothetical protein
MRRIHVFETETPLIATMRVGVTMVSNLIRDMHYVDAEAEVHIENIAVMYRIPVEDLKNKVLGLYSTQTIALLCITEEQKRQLQLLYTRFYEAKATKVGYRFDFDSNQIIPNHGRLGSIFTFLRHMTVACGHLQEAFRRSPSLESLDKFLAEYNSAINTIGQRFPGLGLLRRDREIHLTREKKPLTNYKPGLTLDATFGLELDPDDLIQDWKREFLARLQDLGSLEKLKLECPSLYGQMAEFHKQQMICLHDNHKLDKSHRTNFARSVLRFRNTRPYCGLIVRGNFDKFNEKFQKFSPFGKVRNGRNQTKDLFIGAVCIQCPCFSDGIHECKTLFDITDDENYEAFAKIFDGYELMEATRVFDPDEPEHPISAMFQMLTVLRNPDKRPNMRTHTMCPFCATVLEENPEHAENMKGNNIIRRHSQDVTCPGCGSGYCTDCGGVHPGIICNGIVGDINEAGVDKRVQACPGCAFPTDRISGCPNMQCGMAKCGISWCWNCRLYTSGEGSDNIHYCPTTTHYRANPRWRDDPTFVPYTSTAPSNGDW